jgi:carbonic anhydrase
MRSLALACAIKGGKEIAIIGHNDCLVGKTTTMKLTDAFRALGVERAGLPDNLTEFFGMFASEQQNVMKGVEFVRHSPLIGPKVPVHGLMVNIATGKLEWVVNGYHALDSVTSARAAGVKLVDESVDSLRSLAAFKIGEMKFPDTKIGDIATQGKNWLAHEIQPAASPTQSANDWRQAEPVIYKVPETPPTTPQSPPPPVPPVMPKPAPVPPRVPPVVPRMPVSSRVKPQFNFPKDRNR